MKPCCIVRTDCNERGQVHVLLLVLHATVQDQRDTEGQTMVATSAAGEGHTWRICAGPIGCTASGLTETRMVERLKVPTAGPNRRTWVDQSGSVIPRGYDPLFVRTKCTWR